jgi:hypothetical protein
MSQNDSIENKVNHANDAGSERINPATVQGLYSEPSTFRAATSQTGGADVSQHVGGLTLTDTANSANTTSEKHVASGSLETLATPQSTEANVTNAPITMEGLKVQSEKLFQTLDPNHTGSISMDTLAHEMGNSHITGDQAKALAALYGMKAKERGTTSIEQSVRFGNAEELVITPQEPILTETEINTLPTSVSDEKRKADYMNYFDHHAASLGLDSNDDGRLSPADLQKYTPSVRSDYQTVINNYLIQNPNLADASQIRAEGLNPTELAQATEMQNGRSHEADALAFGLNRANNSIIEPTNGPLYSDAQDPLKSINMDAIKQGRAGDCYFESSLADVANLQPSIIRDSIETNKDGTFKVTFKGDSEHPITVAPPTEAEQETFNGTTKNGLWADVMEKAFGAYEVKYGGRQATDETNVEAASGGHASTAIELLTGNNNTHAQYLEPSAAGQSGRGYAEQKDTMEASLANAVSNGDYAVVGTTNWQNLYRQTGLVPNHDYTVTGYTPGPNGGTFELRNPYGDAGAKNDRFEISGNSLEPHIYDIATAGLQ